MNNLQKITVLLISIFCFSCTGKAQSSISKQEVKENTIEVFDFHTTNRCITCKAIEANTQYTLETYFAQELESGKITFKVINIDDDENYELAKKFKASGTSLFLNIINSENEKQVDLTAFAFTYGKKKDVFSEKLKNKIEKHLEKL
jgi:hypothetical protein